MFPHPPTGQSKEEIEKSPFVERLLKKGYEVIYFTDVLDEYVMQHMTEYDDKKFADASKDELKMRDKDEKETKRDKVRMGTGGDPSGCCRALSIWGNQLPMFA